MKTQIWTAQQLIRFSDSMATALGSGCGAAVSGHKDDSWTTEKLVNMSRHLARAYYPGL